MCGKNDKLKFSIVLLFEMFSFSFVLNIIFFFFLFLGFMWTRCHLLMFIYDYER